MFQAQRELGVLLTEPSHRDMQHAVALFTKAAEQQVLFMMSTHRTISSVVLLLVVLVVTTIRKMPKALFIRNGKLRNFAHTFVTSFPTDLPS